MALFRRKTKGKPPAILKAEANMRAVQEARKIKVDPAVNAAGLERARAALMARAS